MDPTTRAVKAMYEQFPYPSRAAGTARFRELRNLLQIFSRETGYEFARRAVLDAGTGTGHRLAEAARAFGDTQFTGVDFSEESLRAAAQHPDLGNVTFRPANLLDDLSWLGAYDVVLCMGVLHHLESPRRGVENLVRCLADDGMLFLYVYGRRGARERMRRKEIVRALMADSSDFEEGLHLVKDLGFDSGEYGWNLATEDSVERDALLVDAYLNVHESLYTSDEVHALLDGSGLSSYAIYGVSAGQSGYLFDAALDGQAGVGIPRMKPRTMLRTDRASAAYERLALADRIRVLDLLYEPNGYTIVAFRGDGPAPVVRSPRIRRNLVALRSA